MPPPQPQRPLTDRGDVDEKGNLTDRGNWVSGLLMQFAYTNFHHDPHPICTVLYSDRLYTHAVNVSYLNGQQRRQFKAGLKMWYFLDPRLKYYWLKRYNASSLVGYRTYFTAMLHPVSAWDIDELKGAVPQAYSLKSKVNGPKPTDFAKFSARAVGAAVAHAQAIQRGVTRPNLQRPDPRIASGRVRPLLERVRQAVTRLNAAQFRPRSQRPGE